MCVWELEFEWGFRWLSLFSLLVLCEIVILFRGKGGLVWIYFIELCELVLWVILLLLAYILLLLLFTVIPCWLLGPGAIFVYRLLKVNDGLLGLFEEVYTDGLIKLFYYDS